MYLAKEHVKMLLKNNSPNKVSELKFHRIEMKEPKVQKRGKPVYFIVSKFHPLYSQLLKLQKHVIIMFLQYFTESILSTFGIR